MESKESQFSKKQIQYKHIIQKKKKTYMNITKYIANYV